MRTFPSHPAYIPNNSDTTDTEKHEGGIVTRYTMRAPQILGGCQIIALPNILDIQGACAEHNHLEDQKWNWPVHNSQGAQLLPSVNAAFLPSPSENLPSLRPFSPPSKNHLFSHILGFTAMRILNAQAQRFLAHPHLVLLPWLPPFYVAKTRRCRIL